MNIFGKDNLGGRKTTGKIYECPDDGKRNDEKRNDGKRNDVLKRRHKEGMILKPRIEEGHTGIS